MRFAIYDGILEEHLASTLQAALEARGHSVLNTGRFGAGFRFNEEPEFLSLAHAHIEQISSFSPDVTIVFRPASLPPTIAPRLRAATGALWAWMCDDPVLWDVSYRESAPLYDVVLHCGDVDVLNLYEQELGRASGVNFPFWTSSEAFPYSYLKGGVETDLAFLGNAQGALRRRRYHELTRIRTPIRLYGLTGTDYRGVNGGYLDSDAEVVDAFSRVRAAVNIPQYFSDHRGLETWFDGLDRFGYFPFPSRVIQYAAMGVPVISVVPDGYLMRTFPEILTVPNTSEIDSVYERLLASGELSDLSLRTAQRMRSTFSAESRALAIESLATDESWRQLDAVERAEWFSHHPPAPAPSDVGRVSANSRITLNEDRADSRRNVLSDFVATTPRAIEARPLVVGVVRDDYFGVIARALKNASRASFVAARTWPEVESELYDAATTWTSVWVSSRDLQTLRLAVQVAKSLRILLHVVHEEPPSIDASRELEKYSGETGLIKTYTVSQSFPNVRGAEYIPAMVDRTALLEVMADGADVKDGILVARGRAANWRANFPHVYDDLLTFGEDVVEQRDEGFVSRLKLAVWSGVAVLFPQGAGPAAFPDWSASFGGLLGATIFYGRTAREFLPPGAGDTYLTVREPGELLRKRVRAIARPASFRQAAENDAFRALLSSSGAEEWVIRAMGLETWQAHGYPISLSDGASEFGHRVAKSDGDLEVFALGVIARVSFEGSRTHFPGEVIVSSGESLRRLPLGPKSEVALPAGTTGVKFVVRDSDVTRVSARVVSVGAGRVAGARPVG